MKRSIHAPRVTHHDLDTYCDTAGGALAAGGYACHLRLRNGGIIAALKGLGGAQGAVHRRAEWEGELASPTPAPAPGRAARRASWPKP